MTQYAYRLLNVFAIDCEMFSGNPYTMPLSKRIRQGEMIKRSSELVLNINEHAHILVSGLVKEIGSGVINL